MFYHYSSLVVSCGRFHARMKICDNFPKYVVFLDEFDMSRNGIKHRNIRDFLSAEEWN